MVLAVSPEIVPVNTVAPGITNIDFSDLHGRRIDLIALDRAAIDDIHAYSIIPEFYRYFEFPPFTSREETEKYFGKLCGRSNGITGHYWMIRLRETGQVIGTFGVLGIDRRKGSGEIGYGLSPAQWGNGLFSETLALFLEWAFGPGQFHRIWAKTQADNVPSINALAKMGFQREGTMRDFYLSQQDNRRHDAVLLSILRTDGPDLWSGTPEHHNSARK
jgi:ribosomal-protein-alanine N-acetyltransferase